MEKLRFNDNSNNEVFKSTLASTSTKTNKEAVFRWPLHRNTHVFTIRGHVN